MFLLYWLWFFQSLSSFKYKTLTVLQLSFVGSCSGDIRSFLWGSTFYWQRDFSYLGGNVHPSVSNVKLVVSKSGLKRSPMMDTVKDQWAPGGLTRLSPITMAQVWTLVVLSLTWSCVPTMQFSLVHITIACVLQKNSVRKRNTGRQKERENCAKVIICCWINFGLKKWTETKTKRDLRDRPIICRDNFS